MKLVYEESGERVDSGDHVTLRDGEEAIVEWCERPHKPSSQGHVTLRMKKSNGTQQFYVSVIEAKWVEREDRGFIPIGKRFDIAKNCLTQITGKDVRDYTVDEARALARSIRIADLRESDVECAKYLNKWLNGRLNNE